MIVVRVRWNPSQHPTGIQGYEVLSLFNGMQQGCGMVNPELWESRGVPGQTHVTLQVVAVANSGQRSQTANFEFDVPPDTPPPPPPPYGDPTTPDGFTVEFSYE